MLRILTSHNNINKISYSFSYSPNFMGKDFCCPDCFEHSGSKKVTLFDPYTMEVCSDTVNINPSVKQDIMLESKDFSGKKKSISFNYEPNMTDVLKDKSGKDLDVCILKSVNPKNKNQFAYHIMSDDLSEEYGYVCMSEQVDKKDKNHSLSGEMHLLFNFIKRHMSNTEPQYRQDLTKNYNNKIVGDRVEIEYFQNLCPGKVSGVGCLAAKLAVQHCYENDISPNVVLYSTNNAHISNYKNGYRFLPLDSRSEQSKKFINEYGTDDVNLIMEKISSDNDYSKTVDWNDLGMYMPTTTCRKLAKSYKKVDMDINNPFEPSEDINLSVYMDMSKPRKISALNTAGNVLTIDYNPKRNGVLFNKATGNAIDVNILKLSHDDYADEDVFCFMSKDLKKRYGYVDLDRNYDNYGSDLSIDYDKQGIKGDRVVVKYLKNEMKDSVGGVGKLADRVAVQYCIENGINPRCIVSHAAEGSHVAHYKRGKRFITPSKSSLSYKQLEDNYGEPNPNRILKKLIKNSSRNDCPVDIDGWGYFNLVMYLPEKLVDKYSKEEFK